MGVVESFKETSVHARFSLILLTIADLFVWIAFVCTGWGESDDGRHYGLWRSCTDNRYNPGCTHLDGWANDWWVACQALMTLAFFGLNIALFLTCLYIFRERYKFSNDIVKAVAAICMSTGILYLLGIIVFGAKFTEDFINPADSDPDWPEHTLSYCFALSIMAFFFEIAAGVLMILNSNNAVRSLPPMPE